MGGVGKSSAHPYARETSQTSQSDNSDLYSSNWTALGDSYSAGPGAGDDYDSFEYGGEPCYRSKGAYGPQIEALSSDDVGHLQFLSCTGHKTANVTEYQQPDILWGELESDMRVTLSVGLSDLYFSEYVKACLIGFGWMNCSETLDKINNLLDNNDGQNSFRDGLYSVWKGIINENWSSNPYMRRHVPSILHTLYPTLFNASTDHCNNEGMFDFSVKFTHELRNQTNDLVQRANDMIGVHAETFMRDNWEWLGSIEILDYNNEFDGHRLCEAFVTEAGAGFDNDNVWFLDISGSDTSVAADETVDIDTCDPDSGDLGEAVSCEVARYQAQHPDEDFDGLESTPKKQIAKVFHPKSAGFQVVRDRINEVWFRNRPQLRVLPLGDSITNGFQSTNGAGYRDTFYELATMHQQYTVDMIGSVKAGNMSDNDNEGHNGANISQISAYADLSLGQRPNVVLLHAGTNDMASDASADGAVDRLAALIDKILEQCSDATVLVARIIASSNSATQDRIDAFNAGVEAAIASRAADGKHVHALPMDDAVTADDLFDGIHPNDKGYARMGTLWWGGVKYILNKGWLEDPVAGDAPANSTCSTVPTWMPQGTIASGGGLGAGRIPGRNCTGTDTCSCTYTDDTEETVDNESGDECSALDRFDTTAVIMADIDGDGRDDYMYTDKKGKVTMYLNTGRAPDDGSNAGKVQWAPMGVIATGVGARGDQIRFADLDGDGRAEYIWVKDSGSATVWWNRGFNASASTKVIWGSATGEEIATGIGDGQGVVFADMNGDGKADFIHLAPNGAATLYINQGRRASGGWGWWNWGEIAAGVGSDRENIRFADFNGDGRDDYVVVDPETGGLDVWYNRGTESGDWASVSSIIWWNPGKPIASGVSYLPNWSNSMMVTFGDLNKDGRDDYLYVGLTDASIYAFINGC
ncbi:hypothetical protein E8E14_013182 [Neopestalotiopsis sp. 37M]|nr:hypothetical protein E8E14_013182 [Neopestalotiopsis sp. 37M]